MKVRSIRFRLLAFALAAVFLGLTVSGLGLVALFGRHVERRVGTEWVVSLQGESFPVTIAADHKGSTVTFTESDTKLSGSPTKVPDTGIVCRIWRATATGIRLKPPIVRLVGSNMIHPAPGT